MAARIRQNAEPVGLGALITVLIVSLFIPKAIALNIGPIALTPGLAASLLLFPALLILGRIRWDWPEIVILLLFASWTLSNIRSVDLGTAIENSGRNVLIGLVPYMAGRYITLTRERTKKAMTLLITITAVMAVFAILESRFGFNIHSKVWRVYIDPYPEKRLGLIRAQGWTTHPIMYGLVCASFMPVAAVAVIERMKIVGMLPLLKLFALGVGTFLSLSTGAWGPAFVAMCFVFYDYVFRVKPYIRWPLMFGGAFVSYYALELLSNRPLLRILMMDLHLSSADAWHYRWMLYERVYQVMPGNWWFGHGLKTPAEFLANNYFSIDNNFLVVLMNYGRIGLFLWLAVFASVLLYGGKAVWAGLDTPYVRFTRAVMYALIGITLTQLSVALFSTPETLYWMLAGIAVGASQVCRKEARDISIKKIKAARQRILQQRRRQAARRASMQPT